MGQTIKERLEEVRTAISQILAGGQSYRIGSRSLTRADLAQLYKMQNELEAQLDEESSYNLGRGAAAVFFDRR